MYCPTCGNEITVELLFNHADPLLVENGRRATANLGASAEHQARL